MKRAERHDRDVRLAALARQRASLLEQLAQLARDEAEVLAGAQQEAIARRRATHAVVAPQTPVDDVAAQRARQALARAGFVKGRAA